MDLTSTLNIVIIVINVYIHSCLHTYIRTHIHTYIYIYIYLVVIGKYLNDAKTQALTTVKDFRSLI